MKTIDQTLVLLSFLVASAPPTNTFVNVLAVVAFFVGCCLIGNGLSDK